MEICRLNTTLTRHYYNHFFPPSSLYLSNNKSMRNHKAKPTQIRAHPPIMATKIIKSSFIVSSFHGLNHIP